MMFISAKPTSLGQALFLKFYRRKASLDTLNDEFFSPNCLRHRSVRACLTHTAPTLGQTIRRWLG